MMNEEKPKVVMVGKCHLDVMFEADEARDDLGEDVVMILKFESTAHLRQAMNDKTVSFADE